MKSGAFSAGQFNLKGKLTQTLSCRCCVAQNFKHKENHRLAQQEIDQAYTEFYTDGPDFDIY